MNNDSVLEVYVQFRFFIYSNKQLYFAILQQKKKFKVNLNNNG